MGREGDREKWRVRMDEVEVSREHKIMLCVINTVKKI